MGKKRHAQSDVKIQGVGGNKMEQAKYMDIWNEFRNKLKYDTLTESDFTAEMRAFLQPLLCGECSAARRRKFLEASYDVYESDRGPIL